MDEEKEKRKADMRKHEILRNLEFNKAMVERKLKEAQDEKQRLLWYFMYANMCSYLIYMTMKEALNYANDLC
jgi:hypothetical protein